ncbi:hypothetical protein KP509_23G006500 [Ceratopteris richardii]|nr:hypothetical protein KP509_23G006500 [Ceratopteris richardii]
MDTIALMLSLANVGAHAEVLVMDLVSGILTAAVAERIGGFGSVCTVYCTDKPSPLDIVGLLNLTPSMAGRVFRVSVWELTSLLERHGYVRENHELVHLKKESEGDTAVSGDGNGNLNVEIEAINFDRANKPLNDNHTDTHLQSDLDACTSFIQASAENSESCESTHRNDEKEREAQESMVARSKESNSVHYGRKPDPEDLSRWAKHGFTGLLVSASDYQPWSVIEKLLPFLSPSAAFAIHHRYLQPLAECMHELQRNRMAVALEIVEPWLREYQVLPSRTHPCMQMNATGGYILTGIKISSP